MFDLSGKTALVTGASGGIGSAIAQALSNAGAKLLIHGTNLENLVKTNALLSNPAEIITANLAVRAEVQELAKMAESADILVNNAGLTADNLSLLMKEDEWDRVIEVNLTATFFLCKYLAKQMMRRKYGRIINISSIVGQTGNGGQANYVASKAGVIGLSKSLAMELAGRWITVNCIAPGFIDTAMTAGLKPAQSEAILNTIPLKRMGTPQDIAAGVLYLASSEAGFVTGATLNINGGQFMQ